MKTVYSVLLLTILALACGMSRGAAVQELTPDNFDSVVGKGFPALVEFFAPWCGHCKQLAPVYEELAAQFESSPVVVASVDADKHRALGSRFGVSGFPTLKWFPEGSTDGEAYSGGRSLEDLTDFINRKAGTNVKIQKAPSAVVELTDDTFDSIVLDETRDVFVEFFAPWCGHCKRLAPEYEKAAASFVGDDVVIASIDADRYKQKAGVYGVTGFPTLKWFPKDQKQGLPYSGDRTAGGIVDFINEEAGTERQVGGGFTMQAGLIEDLESFVTRFKNEADNRDTILEETKRAVDDLKDHKNNDVARFYVSTMKKTLEKGEEYAKNEYDRLGRLISSGSVKKDRLPQFFKRRNIVRLFV